MNINYYKSSLQNASKYAEQLEVELLDREVPPPIAFLNLNRLGSYYYNKEQYAKARNIYNKAERLWYENNLSNKEDLNLGTVFNNYGLISGIKGEVYVALENYKQAIREYEDNFEHNYLRIAIAHYNIASSYESLRDYDQALLFINNSILIHQDFPLDLLNKRFYAGALLKKGQILEHFENYSDAEKCYQSVLNFSNMRADYYALATKNLGILALKKRKIRKAKILLEKSLQQHLSFFKVKHYRTAQAFMALGKVYEAKEENLKALFSFQKALCSVVPNFSDSLNYRSNPSIDQHIESKLVLLKVLRKKAQLQTKLGELRNALETYKLQAQLINDIRKDYYNIESKYFLSENATTILEEGIQLAYALYQEEKKQNLFEDAFFFMEASKASVLLEHLLKNSIKEKKVDLPDSILLHQEEVKAKLAFYQRKKLELSSNNSDLDRLDEKIVAVKHQLNKLTDTINNHLNNDLQKLYTESNHSLSIYQDNLLVNQSLIVFYIQDSTVYVAAISADNYRLSRVSDDSIEHKIKVFLELIKLPKSNWHSFQDVAFYLYQNILQSSLTNLPASINELIMIPDGILASLPLELLVTQQNEKTTSFADLHYLQNDYTITYALSATLLAKQLEKKVRPSDNTFVGFAPSFQGTRSLLASRTCDIDSLAALAHNETEVTEIAALVEGQFYAGDQATKSTFLDQCKTSRVLHLATHACVNDQQPDQSRIYLTDDYFYLQELYNLDLSADMVVLSACETGVGAYQKGEGIRSLAHGFTYAGVPSTTMSLWSVNDASTSQLMQSFYQHLTKGKPKHVALRQAKLDYLDNQESLAHLHPYYWAGFVHLGNYEAIELGNQIPYPIWGLGAMVFLGLIGFSLFQNFRKV